MVAAAPAASRLSENIMQFARALRAAGLPVGPGKAIDAIEAVKAVGIGDRDDFYWTLHAVFVQRREQREIFDQAFHIFWRNPQFLQRMMSLMLPQFRGEEIDKSHQEISPRVADALRGNQAGHEGEAREPDQDEIEVDAALTFSSRELLQSMDFEKMTLAEIEQAKKAIAAMRLPVEDVPTRRFKRDARGHRVDMRATLRAGLRDPDIIPAAVQVAPPAPAAAGDPVRHLRLDEPLFAPGAAFHPRPHDRSRPCAQLPVRHAPHQHHAAPAAPRRRRGARPHLASMCRTGPAARASAIAWRSSTGAGRGGCWARARWSC